MSDRFEKSEVVQIPDFQAGDTAKWQQLKRMYLAQQIPGIIVRELPVLSRQALFDLEGVSEHSSRETRIAINYRSVSGDFFTQTEHQGLHFDTGKVVSNEATTNRVEKGKIGISLIEGTPDFTAKWGTNYKRNPEVPQEAMEAYTEGLIDTNVFTPVLHAGEAGPYDALFSRNFYGNVLAHDITSLTPRRLSFIQGVLLVD